jgi:type IV secretory pathway VirB9-like protein
MRHPKFLIDCVLVVASIGAVAQDSARTVQYHSQDIVPIRAKVKYTTLIELPTTEKIMEAATGDKDFWIVDVVGNFCFVHPAKQGISSNLNLITDKGNIYSFTLQDISGSTTISPDLKVIVEPADRSAIVAASGPPQFVPVAQLEQSRQQLAALQSHVEQAVDEYKSAIQRSSSSTTSTRRTNPPSISSRSTTTTSSRTSRPMRQKSSASMR